MSKDSLFCSRASNCLAVSLIVFIRFILYWVPTLTELLILSVNGTGTSVAKWTIGICSIVQILVAFVAGARLTYQIKVDKLKCVCCCDDRNEEHLCTDRDFCCPSSFAAKSIWSGSNLSFVLPAWILTNLISSWADAKYLVWWQHLLCYLPFPSYALGLAIGYVWTQTCEDDYESVPSA